MRTTVVAVLLFLTTALSAADPADYQRYLMPVAARDLAGANGSLWTTELTLHNGHFAAVEPIWNCCGPILLPQPAPVIPPNETYKAAIRTRGDGTDGAFIYLPLNAVARIGMSLRVRDVSQNARNFGTEIPLVKPSDYVGILNVPLQLIDVPTDPKYRATLRVYGPDQAPVQGVRMRIYSQDSGQLIEERGIDLAGIVTALPEPFPLHPAYAQLDPLTPAVRASGDRVRIELYAHEPSVLIPPPAIPLWAMVTITNNETQQVTTVTPKR